jgi:hypothetical protein
MLIRLRDAQREIAREAFHLAAVAVALRLAHDPIPHVFHAKVDGV